MQPGAYSSRFKMFQKEQVEQMKKDYQEETLDLMARNHRLHVETNRRRKAYAQKKKTQAQREERRRQMILARRRQVIQDATEKFQRLNRNTQQTQNNNLKDGSAGPKYTLDEALRMIMGHDRSSSASIQHDHERGPGRRPVSLPADLQSDSQLELKSSRNLFEQQLTQHQQSLATQQQMALRDFSEAMIGGLPPNSTVKTEDHRQGTSVFSSDSLESDKERTGHQSESCGQQAFKINRAVENNPFKSLDKPREWHLHPANANNGTESATAQQHPTDAAFHQHGGSLPPNSAAKNADYHVSNGGLTSNMATSCSKETNQNKTTDSSGLYTGANGPTTLNAGALHSNKTPIYGVPAETNYTSGGSVVSEAGSASGVMLHRSVSAPSPNIAIVQPNRHTNHFSTNTVEKQMIKVEEILPSIAAVGKNSIADHSTMNRAKEPQLNGEIVSNGNQQDAVVSFVAGQTMNGGDPGTFVVMNGLSGRTSLLNKQAMSGPYHTNQSPGHALESSAVNKYETKFADIVSVSSKVADSDLKSLSTYPTKTNDPSMKTVQGKPPAGRWKMGEMSKSGTTAPGMERRETREWQTAGEGSRPNIRPQDVKPVAVVEQGMRQMDIRQTNDTKQHGTRLEDSAQQGTSLPETKPQLYSDEVYIDETSSSSSASSIRPVSRIPVPSPVSTKVPKGILKKRPSSCITRPDSGQRQLAGLPRSASMSTMSASLRDSVEVTKQHRRGEEGQRDHENFQKPGKKSVRFAEVLCEEEPDRPVVYNDPGQISAEKVFFYPRPPLQERIHTDQPAVTRPMRPISAKVISTTPAVDASVKVPRVASAGMTRRVPFHNPAVPSDSNHPTSATSRTSNQLPTNSVSNPPINGLTPSLTGVTSNGICNVQPLSDKAARDISGISLDKTPTEEEINWLWEKVRSCLNREPSSASMANNSNGIPQTRQTVQVPCTNFDGSSLMTRPSAGAGRVNSTYVNNYMGSQYPVRRRITMETLNAYTKRTTNSLLQQRRVTQPNIVTPAGPLPQTSACFPVNGLVKSDVNPTTRVNAGNNHVTESMAAFLAAEELTRHVDLDDSLISNVMDAAERRARTFNSANPTTVVVPSALSIEEERLMKSIDRLNEKLSAFPANQQQASQPGMVAFVPKPPPYATNKTRLQTLSTRRIINCSGAVPRQYFQINRMSPAINSQFKRTT